MAAEKTIIELGLAARINNPGFFFRKMPKVVHTRLGTPDIALFDEIKQIYVCDFSFSRIFLEKYFIGLKITFARFHSFSLAFAFIHSVLKILFRKVHKKVHTCENHPSFLHGIPTKSFVKNSKPFTEICLQITVFRAMSILFYNLINKPRFLIKI